MAVPCPVQAHVFLFFFCLGSFFVFLRRDSCWLVLSLAQRCVAACCLSFGILGGSLVRFRGWCWFCGCGVCFLFSPPLLSSTSQGCVPFPVCRERVLWWRCSGFFSSGCGETCFFFSRLFCRSLVFAKASDWWSSFFFFLLEPFVGSVVLSVGVAQAFFFTLFLGAFVSLLYSEASFPIHFAFGFGLLAASNGFLCLLTSLSVFLHQFWRLCV